MATAEQQCWICNGRALIRGADGRAICAACFVEALRTRSVEFERIVAVSRGRKSRSPAAEERPELHHRV
ncbi:MAG TPA: hypothetical protein VI814_04340 [Candidatus Limnocylindria bacterium]